MNLYLVRHTKVKVTAGICYGDTDVRLKSSFPEEARELKYRLDNICFTHCFSSPLSRCRILAETIATDPLTIQYDERLKELNFGKWEGRLWSHLDQTPEAKQWFDDYLNTPCPGGESYAKLLERIRSFIEDLKQLPDSSEVLVITHGGPIRCFQVILEDIDSKKIFDNRVEYGEVKNIKYKNLQIPF